MTARNVVASPDWGYRVTAQDCAIIGMSGAGFAIGLAPSDESFVVTTLNEAVGTGYVRCIVALPENVGRVRVNVGTGTAEYRSAAGNTTGVKLFVLSASPDQPPSWMIELLDESGEPISEKSEGQRVVPIEAWSANVDAPRHHILIGFSFRSAWGDSDGKNIIYSIGTIDLAAEIGSAPPCDADSEPCGDRCCLRGCASRAEGAACDSPAWFGCGDGGCCVGINWAGACGYGGLEANLRERACNPNGSCCPLGTEPCALGCCESDSTTTTTLPGGPGSQTLRCPGQTTPIHTVCNGERCLASMSDVGTRGFPYNVIGRIVGYDALGGCKVGSGTVITEHGVVTAAHVLWNPRDGWLTDLTFQQSYLERTALREVTGSTATVLARFQERSRRETSPGFQGRGTASRDFAVIRFVDQPAGGAYAGWSSAARYLRNKTYKELLGYGISHGSERLLRSIPTQAFAAFKQPGLFGNATGLVEGGMSGGPVLVNDAGEGRVVAVHVGAEPVWVRKLDKRLIQSQLE